MEDLDGRRRRAYFHQFLNQIVRDAVVVRVEGDVIVDILCGRPHNAEDFKQGARTHGESSVVGDQLALCLKFRCAKPLEGPSSYVF